MISIIIPTLNEESVIERTLTGLKSKLTIPHEIIISDGHSKDKTVEIASRIADRVLVHSEARRQTIAEGRNVGARAAKGDLLVFLDADCSILEPDRLFNNAVKQFENPELSALVAWIKVIKSNETWADALVYFVFNNYSRMMSSLFNIGISGGEFQMMRKKDFDAIGGYNQKLVASEDVELLNRLGKSGKIKIDRNLIVYHSGRRAHKIGWPKLLYQWMRNTIYMVFTKQAHDTEWEPIR